MADDLPADARRAAVGRFLGLFSGVLDRSTVTVLVLAALLAGVGATGGWAGAQDQESTLLAADVGAALAADPLTVTVKKAFVADTIPTLAPARPGSRFVLVTVTVENTSPRPVDARVTAASFGVSLQGLRQFGRPVPQDSARPDVVRAIDATPLGALQPGIEQNLALVWEQDAAQQVPDTVSVVVIGHTWRISALDGSWQWFDPTPAANVELPLAPLPAA